MNYKELFNITLNHNYFSPNTCDDLIILPQAATNQLLKNQHFIFKSTSTGIKVLTPLDENENMAPVLDPNDTLKFNVFPISTAFNSYTDFSKLDDGEIFCFTNKELKKSSENLISSGRAGSTSYNGFSSIATIEIWPTEYLLNEKDWPKQYQVSFDATSVKWKYYLVSNKGVNDVAIDDKQNEITFKKKDLTKSTSDQIAFSLKSAFPDSNLYLFESKTAIMSTYNSRKNLQLIRDGHVIVKHMPNPTVLENGIKIINTLN